MRLGILVTTARHPGRVGGIAKAALAKGHAVTVFVTDEGVRLLADRSVVSLGVLPGVTMSYCRRSAEARGVAPSEVPGAVAGGTQYDNALMCAESDKVIVL